MTYHLHSACRTHRGLVRPTNQDSIYAGNRLLAVADGMGGHAGGETAARLVISAFVPLDDLPPDAEPLAALLQAVERGTDYVCSVVTDTPALAGMGTTVTALLFGVTTVAVAQVGDSRAYLYRDHNLEQITHDQTLVQALVDNGIISQGQADHDPRRSVLLQAVGGRTVEPAISLRNTVPGDRYLLCTDGLYRCVPPDSIAEALAQDNPEHAASALIDDALAAGAPDNITVLVADVVDQRSIEATTSDRN